MGGGEEEKEEEEEGRRNNALTILAASLYGNVVPLSMRKRDPIRNNGTRYTVRARATR